MPTLSQPVPRDLTSDAGRSALPLRPRWDDRGKTKTNKGNFTVMAWYGDVLGSLGWLGVSVLSLILLDRQAWQPQRFALASAPGNST